MKVLKKAYTFDDVLLLPRYSEFLPTEVNTETELGHLKLKIPILSAAMDTVTEATMALAMHTLGGLGVVHKNLTSIEQASHIKHVKMQGGVVGAAVGVSEVDKTERIANLIEAGVDMLVIDTAHGHSKNVIKTLEWVKNQKLKNLTLVVGNIATAEAAIELANAGADVVKVGIGPGSICTTRVIAGIGVPQLTAIFDVAEALKHTNVKIIADGGIRTSGDIVKALAAGAHAVMLGNLLASTFESPGEIVTLNDGSFKQYRGMGSLAAMKHGSKDRYFQAQVDDKKLIPEGVEGFVPIRGSVGDVVHQLVGGLRAGMGYIGAANLKAMPQQSIFIEISQASLNESHVHDVIVR